MNQNIKNFIEEGEKELSSKLIRYGSATYEGIEGLKGEDADEIEKEIIKDRKEFVISLIKMIVNECAESFHPYCGGDKEGDVSCYDKLVKITKIYE